MAIVKMNTLEQFFSRGEARNFPCRYKPKPYTKVISQQVGSVIIRGSHKESGSAKIEVLFDKEVVYKLYLQGVGYDELQRELIMLREILTKEII